RWRISTTCAAGASDGSRGWLAPATAWQSPRRGARSSTRRFCRRCRAASSCAPSSGGSGIGAMVSLSTSRRSLHQQSLPRSGRGRSRAAPQPFSAWGRAAMSSA
ncbi:unnamed protein product, partial [Effrenium voratum]